MIAANSIIIYTFPLAFDVGTKRKTKEFVEITGIEEPSTHLLFLLQYLT